MGFRMVMSIPPEPLVRGAARYPWQHARSGCRSREPRPAMPLRIPRPPNRVASILGPTREPRSRRLVGLDDVLRKDHLLAADPRRVGGRREIAGEHPDAVERV